MARGKPNPNAGSKQRANQRTSQRTKQPDKPRTTQTNRGNRGRQRTLAAASETNPVQATVSVKLQKHLADLGVASRREIERWIEAGRISVDGKTATLGARVTGAERILVDDKPTGREPRVGETLQPRVLLLNKAEGVICTHKDPEGRRTVFGDLPRLRTGRWVGVGRLDVATTGLLLVTNDGALAHRMMHPSTGLDREYAVRTDGILSDAQIAAMRRGVISDGEKLKFSDIRYFDGSGENHWYHVTLLEGRNHEVRRLFASQDMQVRRLKRVRYGPVLLPSWLRRGKRFELGRQDLKGLYRTLDMPLRLRVGHPVRRGMDRRYAERSVLIPYPVLPQRAPS